MAENEGIEPSQPYYVLATAFQAGTLPLCQFSVAESNRIELSAGYYWDGFQGRVHTMWPTLQMYCGPASWDRTNHQRIMNPLLYH